MIRSLSRYCPGQGRPQGDGASGGAVSEDLVLRLRRIKDQSRRSLRELERATNISNSALSRYLSGQATPPWNAVVALCSAAGADPRPLRPLWEQAQRARRGPGRQFDVSRPAARRQRARNDLPRDVAAFTARQSEVAELLRLARSGLTAAVDGMGGVGKTALVVHVAHQLAAEFPDCQLYVDLHGFTPGREPCEPGEALLVLLRALDVPGGRIPDGLDERAALWRSELAGRRAVVVLDNVSDADHVRLLLPGAGRHAVLVTSRRRLVDLDGVEPVSLGPLSAGDAADLFSATLGAGAAVGGDGADVVAEARTEAVADLMIHCGGLPLAIRIAAARLRHRPGWRVADLLDRSPADEVGVVQVVDASLARLSAPQQHMFRLLGVFPGAEIEPFAAAALAGVRVPEARAVLEDLVDANLMEEPSPKRYRFHDLIRQRAVDGAAEAPAEEREAALDRLTDFYLHVVALARDTLDEKLEGSVEHLVPVRHVPDALPPLEGLAQMMAWYETESATIDRIIALTFDRGRDDLTVQFALVMGAFLGRRGEMEQWRRITTAAVEAAERRENPGELASVRYFRGIAHRYVGRLAAAQADFAAVHDFAVASGGTGMRVLALWRLASVAEDRGDYRRVLELRRLIAETPGVDRFPTHTANATMTTARSLIRLGRTADATQEAHTVLASAQADDPALRIVCLRALGHAQLAEDDAPAALETFLDAVAVSRAMRHVSYVAVCRGDAAQALSRLGRHAEALDEHEASVTWAADNGELHREIFQREAFGHACLAAGDLDRAEQQFRRTLELAEPRGFRHVAATARLGLAQTLEPSAETTELRAQALAVLEELGVQGPA
jgi:tetratricopeptide (TPR) repeat protein/transcriptional regulator with XRE-family HTH domain